MLRQDILHVWPQQKHEPIIITEQVIHSCKKNGLKFAFIEIQAGATEIAA